MRPFKRKRTWDDVKGLTDSERKAYKQMMPTGDPFYMTITGATFIDQRLPDIINGKVKRDG